MSPSFENRLPPEDINVGKRSVLVEFFFALLGFFLLVVATVILVYLGGSLLARHIPFSWEDRVADHMFTAAPGQDKGRTARLQALADKLASGLELPEGVHFTLHYIASDEVNAFATLGGHIMIHSALIDRLDSENELALVLAHEMAHIVHRDPADALGGRLSVALVMGLFSAAIGTDALESMVGTAQNLTLLSFSRDAEKRADSFALALVARNYGHLNGAAEVFKELAAYEQEHQMLTVPELLNTHPDTLRRVDTLKAEAEKLGISIDGRLTPLPASLRSAKE